MARRSTRTYYRRSARRAIVFRSRRQSYGQGGVSLGVIAGLIPTITDAGQAVSRGEGAYGAFRFVTLDLTGYDILYKNFTFSRLIRGWGPIILGMVAHRMANRFGLNRMIRGIGVPVGI